MDEWKIEPFYERRRILSVYWPNGSKIEDCANRHYYIHIDPVTGKPWIIEMDEDRERARYNVKYVESIGWYKSAI